MILEPTYYVVDILWLPYQKRHSMTFTPSFSDILNVFFISCMHEFNYNLSSLVSYLENSSSEWNKKIINQGE
jgi:hypothetical protein